MKNAFFNLYFRCDNIFDVKFLESMISTSSEFGFSDKLEAYLCFMYQEAICSSNPLDTSITILASSSSSQNAKSSQIPNKSSSSSSSTFTSTTITTTNPTTAITDNSSCQSANAAENQPSGASNATASYTEDMPSCNDAVSVTVVSTSTDPQGNVQMNLKVDKDVRERHHSKDEPPLKRMRFNYSERNPVPNMPPFFYNIHKRKFKGVFLPK